MNNKFTFQSISTPHGGVPQYEYRIHLIMPNQPAPFSRTKLLDISETVRVSLNKPPAFVVVHVYDKQNKLLNRMFSPIDLTRTFLDFRNFVVHYSVETPFASHDTTGAFQAQLEAIHAMLLNYTEKQLRWLEQAHPLDESIRLTHSIFWEFPCQPKLTIPYAALAGRGKDILTGISHETLNGWQGWFMQQLPIVFHQAAVAPSEFANVSRLGDKATDQQQFWLYNTIASVFSRLLTSRIKYAADSVATFKEDYVGFNWHNGILVGDCEDGSQATYDVLKLFREIFPVHDPSHGATSLCYHVSHWLKKAEIWLFQGTASASADSHIWVSLVPPRGGMHYVEATNYNAGPNSYKHVIRAWRRSKGGGYDDVLFLDPSSGAYGIPSPALTRPDANGRAVFRHWSVQQQKDDKINELLDFCTLIDAPLLHPKAILTGEF